MLQRVSVGPVPDQSQTLFRKWVSEWLTAMRKRAGLSQEAAARKADVGIGVVRSAEQQGSPPELPNFLRLVAAYRAERDLADVIRTLRELPHPSVESPPAPPAEPSTWGSYPTVEQLERAARKGKKRRPA